MISLLLAVADLVDPRRLLPPREGSLILVLGGAATLVISLSIALVSRGSRLQHRSHPTPEVGPRPKRSARTRPAEQAPPAGRLDLHEALLKASARAAIGTPQIVTDNPGPHTLVLVDCLTCRPSASQAACRWKKDELEQALRHFDPGADVVGVCCQPGAQQACIFEIRAGDRAA